MLQAKSMVQENAGQCNYSSIMEFWLGTFGTKKELEWKEGKWDKSRIFLLKAMCSWYGQEYYSGSVELRI